MVKFLCGVAIFSALFSHSLQASCCSSAASGGIGRILPHERALIQLNSAARYSFGRFDYRSHFALGNPEKLPHVAFDQEVQAMFRLFRHLEPFAKVAYRLQKSPLAVGGNVANSLVGARILVLSANALGWMPAITALASWEIPTGVVAGQNQEYRAENITSMGEHMLTLGLFLEQSFEPVSLIAGYGFSSEAPFGRDKIVAGHTHSPSVAVSIPLDETSFLSLNLQAAFTTRLQRNDMPVSNSSKRKITLGVSYAKKIHSHISLLAAMGSDMPLDHTGMNNRAEAFINLGMRFGVF